MKLKKPIHPNTLIRTFLIVYLPVTILLALVASVSLINNIPVGIFLRDPAVIADENLIATIEPNTARYVVPFIGIISNLGILLWTVSASICLFCFSIIVRVNKSLKNENSLFLGSFGLITLFLLLDDLLLFHESIAPNLFIPEQMVYAFYGAIVLFALVRFRKVILQTEWIILCLASIFFSLSIGMDIFWLWGDELQLHNFLEDGFKLLGIASWVSYFVITSVGITTNCLNNKEKLISSKDF